VSTPPPKSDPAVAAWLFAEKLLEEEDDARLAKLTDEELRAELEAHAGPEPKRPWTLDEALAAAAELASKAPATGTATNTAKAEDAPSVAKAPPATPEPPAEKMAPVVPIRRKAWRTVAILIAASFVMFMVVKAAQPPPPVGKAPPYDAMAEALRELAFKACDAKDWAQCRQWLDEAAARDPYGDRAEEVRKAREAIAGGVGVDAGGR
jgi:hypothetical protein